MGDLVADKSATAFGFVRSYGLLGVFALFAIFEQVTALNNFIFPTIRSEKTYDYFQEVITTALLEQQDTFVAGFYGRGGTNNNEYFVKRVGAVDDKGAIISQIHFNQPTVRVSGTGHITRSASRMMAIVQTGDPKGTVFGVPSDVGITLFKMILKQATGAIPTFELVKNLIFEVDTTYSWVIGSLSNNYLLAVLSKEGETDRYSKIDWTLTTNYLLAKSTQDPAGRSSTMIEYYGSDFFSVAGPAGAGTELIIEQYSAVSLQKTSTRTLPMIGAFAGGTSVLEIKQSVTGLNNTFLCLANLIAIVDLSTPIGITVLGGIAYNMDTNPTIFEIRNTEYFVTMTKGLLFGAQNGVRIFTRTELINGTVLPSTSGDIGLILLTDSQSTLQSTYTGFACCRYVGTDVVGLMTNRVQFNGQEDKSSLATYSFKFGTNNCSIPSCVSCFAVNVCKTCLQGFYMVNGGCYSGLTTIPQYGRDLVKSSSTNLVFGKCEILGCLDCSANILVCRECLKGYLFINQSVCAVNVSSSLQLADQKLLPGLNFLLRLEDELQSNTDYWWVASPAIFPTKVSYSFQSTGGNNLESIGQLKVTKITSRIFRISLKLKLPPTESPSKLQMTFNISRLLANPSGSQSTLYSFTPATFTHTPSPMLSRASIQSAGDAGTILSSLNAAFGNPYSSWISYILIGADTSGLLVRHFHLIKLFNKLSRLGVRWGLGMQSFLDNIGEVSWITQGETAAGGVYRSTGYRGKLTDKYVDLEFGWLLVDRLPIYFFSWVMFLFHEYIRKNDVHVAKWYLYWMRCHPYFHWWIFNLIAVDVMFYGTSTMFHLKPGVWGGHSFLAYFSMILVLVDLGLLLTTIHVCDLSWKRAYVKILADNKLKEVSSTVVESDKMAQSFRANDSLDISSPVGKETSQKTVHKLTFKRMHLIDVSTIDEGSPLKQPGVLRDQTYLEEWDFRRKVVIDEEDNLQGTKEQIEAEAQAKIDRLEYERNKDVDYDRIFMLMGVYDKQAEYMGSLVKISANNFSDVGCRYLYFVYISRVLFYQLVAVTCQFANLLSISVLLFVELLHILWVVYVLSSEGTRFKLMGCASILQSTFLVFFLLYSCSYLFYGPSDNPSEGSQKFGISMVFIALMCEWALCLANLFIFYLLPLFENTNARKLKRKTVYHEAVLYRRGLSSQKQNDSEIQPVAAQGNTPQSMSPKGKSAIVIPGKFGNETKGFSTNNMKSPPSVGLNLLKSASTGKAVGDSRLIPRDYTSQPLKSESRMQEVFVSEQKEFRNTGLKQKEENQAENSDWDDYQQGTELKPYESKLVKDSRVEPEDGLDKLYGSAIGSLINRMPKQ